MDYDEATSSGSIFRLKMYNFFLIKAILHRDIKPCNIFMDGYVPKLNNFWFAASNMKMKKDK